MTVDYADAVARGDVWVAEDSAGRLVGVLVLERAEDHLLVENLAVAPGHQGRGLGSTLLSHAEDQARALGVPEVRLYTHEAMTENIAFYPRRGYHETHRETSGGFRRVFFSKAVT